MTGEDAQILREGTIASELRASDGWHWFTAQVQETIDHFERCLLSGGQKFEDDQEMRAKRQVLMALLEKPQDAVERAEATRKELADLG